MTLLDDIEEHFGTKDLYEVIGVDKDASGDQIKKAYRRASLKVHPDRVDEDDKERATKVFQSLAQVHYILSDADKRKLYDDHGIISNENGLESEADWADYWRLLFPKISDDDIQKFYDKYAGSREEEEDLIKMYNRFEGDMDKISECHISYDEERTTSHIKRLIKEGKLAELDNFSKEPLKKKAKRVKKAEREARRAEKYKDEMKANSGEDLDNMDELKALINKKAQGNFNNLIANLEAKYAKKEKGVKRKRGN